jgi:hypothetical protein
MGTAHKRAGVVSVARAPRRRTPEQIDRVTDRLFDLWRVDVLPVSFPEAATLRGVKVA